MKDAYAAEKQCAACSLQCCGALHFNQNDLNSNLLGWLSSRRKCIGDDKVITCRPADLIEPELEKYRAEIGDRAKSEEDVLSYALFPAVATKFFEWRDNPHKDEAPAAEAAPAAKPAAPANNGPKTLYVEDLTNGNF